MSSQLRREALLGSMQEADQLSTRLLNSASDERFVFISGSGLTAPREPGAPGVPGVRGIVQMVRQRLSRHYGKIAEIEAG